MAGRPKQFDRELVLDQAMEIYWERGFREAGIEELSRVTGVGRQSLYDTFGDKKQLFLESLDRYDKTITQQAIDLLDAPGSPLANIRKVFELWVDVVTGERKGQGCLVTNAAVERLPHDQAVARRVKSILGRVQAALKRALDRAEQAGELVALQQTADLALYLMCALQGLLIMSRVGSSKAALKRMVNVTLSPLGGFPDSVV